MGAWDGRGRLKPIFSADRAADDWSHGADGAADDVIPFVSRARHTHVAVGVGARKVRAT